MTGDAMWYEAAQVVGITNALNVAADTLGALGAVDESAAPVETRALFAEIRDFYGSADVPQGFRFMAHDPLYAADVWAAARHAFADNRLTRRFKEALAFAVSVSTRSASGAALHLAQMRRLGVGPSGRHGDRRSDADVLELHEDRRHAPARARHGRHRAAGPEPRARRALAVSEVGARRRRAQRPPHGPRATGPYR